MELPVQLVGAKMEEYVVKRHLTVSVLKDLEGTTANSILVSKGEK